MKKIWLIVICCLPIFCVNAQNDLTLWYTTPARVWEEALPLGNGRLGAMVFGDTQSRIVAMSFCEPRSWQAFLSS